MSRDISTVTLARNAMGTRFEIVLHGGDPVSLRAAGEEALDEIERLENRLSLYRPGTDIARVNAGAAREPVRVEPGVFRLLQQARRLSEETGGAFDVSVGPLVRCWGFMGGTGTTPDHAEVAKALELVGMQHVRLDEADFTVRFDRAGVSLDLGAIGKGYAVERAAEVLREAGVASALIHGGTSTVFALGCVSDEAGWNVGLDYPIESAEAPARPLATVSLRDEALSVSAVWGRAFRSAAGTLLGHVIDPRTGEPVAHSLLAAVVLPSATEADALSTALLTLGRSGQSRIAGLRPGTRTLLLGRDEPGGCYWTEGTGIGIRAPGQGN